MEIKLKVKTQNDRTLESLRRENISAKIKEAEIEAQLKRDKELQAKVVVQLAQTEAKRKKSEVSGASLMMKVAAVDSDCSRNHGTTAPLLMKLAAQDVELAKLKAELSALKNKN